MKTFAVASAVTFAIFVIAVVFLGAP